MLIKKTTLVHKGKEEEKENFTNDERITIGKSQTVPKFRLG